MNHYEFELEVLGVNQTKKVNIFNEPMYCSHYCQWQYKEGF